MIRHEKQKMNLNPRDQISKTNQIWKNDGVNSIKYKVVKKTLYSGFTHFLFDIEKDQL